LEGLLHNALNDRKNNYVFVTVIFYVFFGGYLGVFFVDKMYQQMSTDFTSKNIHNYICELCNYKCSKKGDWNRHISTLKHRCQQMSTDFTSKNIYNFNCELCNYKCSKKGDWNRHISTLKHRCQQMTSNFTSNYITPYECVHCNKTYKERTGLWRHIHTHHGTTNEQNDTITSNDTSKPNEDNITNAIITLINQNNELRNIVLEHNNSLIDVSKHITTELISIIKTGQIGNTNNMNSNNTMNNIHNNNTFNLQLFLNETCKNAMNLTDFVNSLNVTIADLEETGRIGFSDGITKIIVKGLKDLDVTERPIHCTDAKRETIYVKEEDVWQKDDNHEKLTKAIKQVSQKNTKNIMEWQRINPEYSDSNSKQSSRFNKLLMNVMSGGTIEEQQGNVSKVVKNISREVVLNKGSMVVV
jgi:hypothetical protein